MIVCRSWKFSYAFLLICLTHMTHLWHEKECFTPLNISDKLMEIVDILETENNVTKYKLEIYDVNGMSHTQ